MVMNNSKHLTTRTVWTTMTMTVAVVFAMSGCGVVPAAKQHRGAVSTAVSAQLRASAQVAPGNATANSLGNTIDNAPATANAAQTANTISANDVTIGITTVHANNITANVTSSIGVNSTSPSGSASKSGAAAPASSNTTTKQSPPPKLTLNSPEVSALDTVTLSGQVLDMRAGETVTLSATDAQGNRINEASVPVQSDGRYNGQISLASAAVGSDEFTFQAKPSTGTTATDSVSAKGYVNVFSITAKSLTNIVTAQTWLNKISGFRMPVPTWWPQTVSPDANSTPYLAVTTFGTKSQKAMQVFQTDSPYGLNDVHISQTGNLIANVVGSQATSVAAAEQLMNAGMDDLTGATGKSVALNTAGSTAILYNTAANDVVWHEGDWTLEVQGPDVKQNIQQAKQVGQALRDYSLPKYEGRVLIQNISTSSTTSAIETNTIVTYREGYVDYQISTQGEMITAVHLAATMRLS